ncbi:MAG: MBL fold metallo-hydrolase [Spirochaetes bacterium]|nr:MBL fold metallo-hydrolase [Spirochaetota bacterium]
MTPWQTQYAEKLLPKCAPRKGRPLGGDISVSWLGTTGLLVSDGNDALLVDPFVTRPPLWKVALARPVCPDAAAIGRLYSMIREAPVRAVLVSHSHYDHSMDAPAFAQFFNCPLLGSLSTVNVARGFCMDGGCTQEITPGDVLRVGRFSISVLESVHGPAFLGRIPYRGTIDEPLVPPVPVSRYRLGTAFSFHLLHPSGSLVVHTSAGFRPGMFNGIVADSVLLGIGGRGDTAEYLEAVVRPLGDPLIVPIHWDHFFIPLDQPLRPLAGVHLKEFLDTAERLFPGRVRTLPLLDAVTLPGGGEAKRSR